MAPQCPTNAIVLIVSIMTVFQPSKASFDQNTTLGSSTAPVIGMPIVDVISNIGRPGALLYNRKSESLIFLDYSLNCTTYNTVYTIIATTSAEKVAKITDHFIFNISCTGLKFSNSTHPDGDTELEKMADTQNNFATNDMFVGTVTGQVNMTVKADMIGRAFLLLFAQKISGSGLLKMNVADNEAGETTLFHTNRTLSYNLCPTESNISKLADVRQQGDGQGMHGLPPNVVGKALIIVMQLPRTIDEVFRIVLYVVIVLATTGMGVKVDLLVIKHVLRRPTAPLIGLCCQYICMPLIAYLVAKVIPQDSAAVSLGIFACGIVPGGGPSNMFSYLLGGDLSLSVTMTTLSNVAALGLLPLWIFTLGDTFKDDTTELHVPYEKILEALAIVILPLFLGIFIKYKIPKVAKIIGKILKPVLIIIVAFTISFGIYINIYIFEMIRPMTIVAGCLLPYIGYVLGGFIAFLCCRSWSHVKTIAIETGIQNTSIAFLILYLSLPPPDNQLATVGPAASAIMTPLPLLVAVFFYVVYQRCTNKRKAEKECLDEKNVGNGNAEMKEVETVTKAILRGDETAAIVILWQKITGQPPKTNILEEMLNKELEIIDTEKQSLEKNTE